MLIFHLIQFVSRWHDFRGYYDDISIRYHHRADIPKVSIASWDKIMSLVNLRIKVFSLERGDSLAMELQLRRVNHINSHEWYLRPRRTGIHASRFFPDPMRSFPFSLFGNRVNSSRQVRRNNQTGCAKWIVDSNTFLMTSLWNPESAPHSHKSHKILENIHFVREGTNMWIVRDANTK